MKTSNAAAQHTYQTGSAAIMALLYLFIWSQPNPESSTETNFAAATQQYLGSKADQFPILLPAENLGTTRQSLTKAGILVSDFAPPSDRWLSGHRGIDFAAPSGSEVFSIATGTVSYVGTVAGKPVISIEIPSGQRVTYEPVHAEVSLGDHITRGSRIGTTTDENTSHCSASCVHIGLRSERSYSDPWPLMSGHVPIVLKE